MRSPPTQLRSGYHRTALAAALALIALAACSRPPGQDARDGCKAVYDRYMRWIQKHQRRPETPAELEEVVLPDRPDPWGMLYILDVDQDATVVAWSNGPDRKPDTEDDIRYPPE